MADGAVTKIVVGSAMACDPRVGPLYKYLTKTAKNRGCQWPLYHDMASDTMLVCIERGIFERKFACGVLRNKMSMSRKKIREREMTYEEGDAEPVEFRMCFVPPNQESAFEVSRIANGIDQLSPKLRETMILKAQEYTEFEAAEELGITVTSLRQRAKRARALLADSLKPSSASDRYLGVRKRGQKYEASINVKKPGDKRNTSIYLGLFDDPRDAARARDKAAAEHFGPRAQLNFGIAA